MDDRYGKPPGGSDPPDDDGGYAPLDGYDEQGFPSGESAPRGSGAYPPPSPGSYPPAGGGYPPSSPGSYPPAGGGYPPAPPGGEHNPYAPPSAAYPPSQGGYGPQPSWQSYALAGRGTRLGAAILDGMLSIAAAGPGLILLFMDMDKPSSEPPWLALGLMMVGALALACYQWYLIAARGQSLAKKWMHIRIVKLDGALPRFLHGVVLRSWVMYVLTNIPFVGSFVALADPLMIFGRERRCLHDLLASTQVIVGDPEDDYQEYGY